MVKLWVKAVIFLLHASRSSFSMRVNGANDVILQANDGKMLVNDGEMLVNYGEMSV